MCAALRSGAEGSVRAPSCIRMNASWKGRQDAAFAPASATFFCASEIDSAGSDARKAATCEAMR
ncbi:Uncharacterised protein [Mycobacteroides abscessus subsp. abscessus]|nr:Uncharacterised protein [Mycobacteroides abscessus subsp. abscessus]